MLTTILVSDQPAGTGPGDALDGQAEVGKVRQHVGGAVVQPPHVGDGDVALLAQPRQRAAGGAHPVLRERGAPDLAQQLLVRDPLEERVRLHVGPRGPAPQHFRVGADAVKERRRQARGDAADVAHAQVLRHHGGDGPHVRADVQEVGRVPVPRRVVVDHGVARTRGRGRRLRVHRDHPLEAVQLGVRDPHHAQVQELRHPLVLRTRHLAQADQRAFLLTAVQERAQPQRARHSVRVRVALHQDRHHVRPTGERPQRMDFLCQVVFRLHRKRGLSATRWLGPPRRRCARSGTPGRVRLVRSMVSLRRGHDYVPSPPRGQPLRLAQLSIHPALLDRFRSHGYLSHT